MPAETLRWVLDGWTGCLAKSLEAMAAQPPRIEWSAGGGPPPDGLLWWEQRFEGLPGAVLWVGAQESSWAALGRGILNAAGVEEVESGEARSTYLELLSQSLASLAHSMTARAGHEVVCSGGREAGPGPGGESFAATVQSAEGPAAALLVRLEGFEALDPQPETAVVPAAGGGAAKPEKGILEVLLDVELPVTVSFGTAQLPLADVLKLTNGSVVELNRTANEPVQVIVNNCVIARGEVVVVEGNYGVRIKEIASRQERLRNLR